MSGLRAKFSHQHYSLPNSDSDIATNYFILYRLPIDFIFIRHTRECGYPVSLAADRWIPAFSGMTAVNTKTYS